MRHLWPQYHHLFDFPLFILLSSTVNTPNQTLQHIIKRAQDTFLGNKDFQLNLNAILLKIRFTLNVAWCETREKSCNIKLIILRHCGSVKSEWFIELLLRLFVISQNAQRFCFFYLTIVFFFIYTKTCVSLCSIKA